MVSVTVTPVGVTQDCKVQKRKATNLSSGEREAMAAWKKGPAVELDARVRAAFERAHSGRVYVEATERDEREVQRARADPKLAGRALKVYDAATRQLVRPQRRVSPLVPSAFALPKSVVELGPEDDEAPAPAPALHVQATPLVLASSVVG